MYKMLKKEVNEGLAIVTIDRPEALNALNNALLSELKDMFTELRDDEAVRAVILTGAGKAFVAGADIAAMNAMTPIEGREMMVLGHSLMDLIEDMEKPVIAAVNGFALGGGCELSMACDIRIASEKAKFGQPETGLGIIPGFGGTQRLPRLVGKAMAKYLLFTSDVIGADRALEIGLVEFVVPAESLMEEAEKIARKIMANGPIAVGLVKKAVNKGYDLPIREATSLEIELETVAFATEDKTEGMTAFQEKRDKHFQNK
ncbi:MAG: enoyl-CoA hydratase/isomerase family protein [Firmicutes bacterium]|nr:enoyl-CoA hydratase/isomerase family protein [Bacillota bacterium]